MKGALLGTPSWTSYCSGPAHPRPGWAAGFSPPWGPPPARAPRPVYGPLGAEELAQRALPPSFLLLLRANKSTQCLAHHYASGTVDRAYVGKFPRPQKLTWSYSGDPPLCSCRDSPKSAKELTDSLPSGSTQLPSQKNQPVLQKCRRICPVGRETPPRREAWRKCCGAPRLVAILRARALGSKGQEHLGEAALAGAEAPGGPADGGQAWGPQESHHGARRPPPQ